MENNTNFTQDALILQEIENLNPWFHNIHLPDGSETAPNHFLGDFPTFKWEQVKPHIPENLSGKTVLDIGCNAGFYSIELAKRGADVLAIDLDPHYLKQAKYVAGKFGLDDKITFKQMQVYDLANLQQTFDIVWFMGVFYHLRYPLLALDIIAQKAKKTMIFQTLTMPGKEVVTAPENLEINDRNIMLENGWPKMAFIEHKLNNDPTNWWAPNGACIEAMLRTSGFNISQKPGHEIYICEKNTNAEAVMEGWNNSEYLSAVGKDWKEAVGGKIVS
ncbi:MAG: TIGR04290 family methyltransferase [Bacteroidetes bacterium]|nr:TIGR04290 family methyltransferase [Bacteroidota bacterium]